MRFRPRRWVLLPVAALLAAAGGLYVSSRSAAVQQWALRQAQARLGAALGRPLSVEAVTLRPWLGALELVGVRVAADPGSPAGPRFAAERVELRWSWSALLRRRIVLRSLTLVQPRLTLPAAGPGALSLTDSLPVLLQAEPPTIDGWPLLVRRATIQGGRVDRVAGGEVREALDGVGGQLAWRGIPQGQPAISGELHAARWQTRLWGKPQELQGIQARLQGAGRSLALTQAEFQADGAQVRASGQLTDAAGNPALDLRVDVQGPLPALPAAPGSAPRPAGSLAVVGRLAGPWTRVTFQGEGTLHPVQAAGPVAPLRFTLAWEDGRLSADTASGQVQAGGGFQASFRLEPETGAYAAEAQLAQADLGRLSGLVGALGARLGLWLPPDLAGRVNADVHLTGQGTDPTTLRGYATLQVDGLLVPGEAAAGRLQAQLTATRDRLTVQTAALDLPGAQIRGSGGWDFRHGALDLPFRADLRDVAAFGRGLGLPALGGRATFQGRLLGTPETPRLQGRLAWRQARIVGHPVDAIEGDVQIAGRTLRTPRLEVRIGRTVASLRGSIAARGAVPLRHLDPNRDLLLDVAGQLGPARTADLAWLLPSGLKVEGAFRARGHLTGSLKALSGEVEVTLASFRTWDESWQRGSTLLKLRRGAVDVTRLVLGRGQEQMGGTIRLGADGSLQGELTSTPMDLARAGMLAGSDLAGQARFRLQFQGTLRDTRTLGQAAISTLSFRDTPFGPGTATFTLDHDVVNLDLTVQQGAERLQAVFSPPPNRTIQATLLLREGELAPVFALAGFHIPPAWQARGTGRLAFRGPAKDLAVSQGDIALDGLRLRLGGDAWENSGPALGSWSGGVLALQPLHLRAGSAQVEVRGRASQGTANDLTLTGQLPLPLLAVWMPAVHPTGGMAAVDLRLRGAWNAPDLQGSLRVQDGRLTVLRFPPEFQSVQAALDLREGRTQIREWTARLAEGAFRGSGEVERGVDQWGLRLSFQEDNGRAEQLLAGLLGGKGEVTGSVSLSGTLTSRGEAAADLWGSLGGEVRLHMRDGRIGRYTFLAKLLSLISVTQLLQLKSPDLSGEAMPYQSLTAHFRIQDGIARTDDLLLDSRAMKVNAVGTIDLRQERVDLTVAIKPFQTVDTVITHIPLAGWLLGGKEKSVLVAYYRITGSLQDPQVRPVPLMSVGRNLFGIFRNLLQLPEALTGPYENLPPQQPKANEEPSR